jgi:3-hydroxyacyl-CoA dehydrogenase
MRLIRRVAVLGAGTMGSRIAAHFANAGVPSLLLDIVVPGQQNRNNAALKGIESALKQKPGGFFLDSLKDLITPGNFDDDLPKIDECDWVIEAVTEDLEIKRALWRRVAQAARADAILSTNTSGIPLRQIAEGFDSVFRRRFLGTHFFNPPRYLHLLEVIPGPETDPALLDFVSDYSDRRLGKGVVRCKDTPNFIGNRIGSFFGATTYKYMRELDLTIEEVDALTGSLIGLPNSASFRLLDIVGIDIWAYVSKNLYEAVATDPWRERFHTPEFMARMIERGWLGEKTGQGFYKRVGPEREIHAIDWKTLEYHTAAKPKLASAEAARNVEDLPSRLKMLVNAKDRAGEFLWKTLSDVFLYSAERVPEISDRIVEIDRAMRWGFAHKLGPFEMWDALGFRDTACRIEKEGRVLPENVARMLSSGAESFYRNGSYFDVAGGSYAELEKRPGILTLTGTDIVKKNAGASLRDIGDGVVCLEFHSKMNSLGDDAISMIQTGLEELAANFEAMVIANEGENFSAGANLMLVLLAAQDEEWDELDLAIRRFQQANMAIKYSPKPVVAAPFARTLGGGAEIVLHAARAQASAELYMGLVEVGVGVIPAAGGCKEMLARLKDPRRVFETIGMAKVSTSAMDAQKLGLLNRADFITMNPERLIADAKALALSLAPNYRPGPPRNDIAVSGEGGYALMKLGAWSMQQAAFISNHDMRIAEKLAFVLSGGRPQGQPLVSEQHLLDLEREAFLSLCGTKETQDRIQHMLKTGKPLRN